MVPIQKGSVRKVRNLAFLDPPFHFPHVTHFFLSQIAALPLSVTYFTNGAEANFFITFDKIFLLVFVFFGLHCSQLNGT